MQLQLRAFEGRGVFQRTSGGKGLVPPEPNKTFKLPWVEETDNLQDKKRELALEETPVKKVLLRAATL
jgi:hypothetical protein